MLRSWLAEGWFYMAEKTEKRGKDNAGVPKSGKFGWLTWTGLSLLVLFLGMAPILVLFTYTRSDLFWNRWARQVPGAEQPLPVADPPPQIREASYLVQYVYRYCNHGYVFIPEELPGDLPAPPPGLVDISLALLNSDLSIAGLAGSINVPPGWHLADLSADLGKPRVLLSYLEDLCPECRGRMFLGLLGNRIAIFEGCPPHGKIMEVTDHTVKDIDRDTLSRGVPFKSEEEKQLFLESYTS